MRAGYHRSLGAALLLVGIAGPVWPADDGAQAPLLADAEKLLGEAGFKTDPASLLGLLRQRTLSEAERMKLATTVRRLGDNTFAVREKASADLVAAGRSAVPLLRAALKDPDLEIVRRAERCLEVIEGGAGSALALAAVRLLAQQKPDGAVEVFLGYLPFADDTLIEEEVMESLATMGRAGDKIAPAIRAALDDREPSRRSAAARVLAKATDPELRRLVRPLLADAAVRVRFQAARALVQAGDKQAMPTLIALLTDAEPELAFAVEELLFLVAGDQRPEISLDPNQEEIRRKARTAWETWWKTHEAKVDLLKVQLEPGLLGFTVIADLDSGRISEIGLDRKERWRVDGFKGPVDVQVLANGHVLVAENHASQVTERDKTGKVIWQRKTAALPASCQRLPNGNTFIATHNQLLEVAVDGKERFSWQRPEGIYCARKLRNGHIVMLNAAGKISFLDLEGKELRTFETGGINSWSSLDLLRNGHLLACCAAGRVVEFDSGGKRVWECTVPNAVCANRLPGGGTLVCDSEGRRVVEVDRAGKVLWEHKTQGRPWHVYRR